MVGDQSPTIARGAGIFQHRTEAVHKPVSIRVAPENVPALDASAYDVMQSTRRIDSGLTRHKLILHQPNKTGNAYFQHSPPIPIRVYLYSYYYVERTIR